MDATRAEDAPEESHYAEMDPERRQFLENALKTLTVDVVEELERAVKTIMDDESSSEEMIESYDIITDYVQDIDSANDFYKVGGFCVIDKGLSSSHLSVKSGALRVLKDLAQNNPFCQEKLLEQGILTKLMELLSNESPDQVSCLSAISTLVRGYEPGLKAFVDMGGLECMMGCIGEETDLKLQIRTAFLIYTISSEYPYLVDELIKLNAIERLTPHIRVFSADEIEDQQQHMKLENILSAMGQLTSTETGANRAAEMGLSEKLEAIVASYEEKEEFLEITHFALVILKRINNLNKEDRADR